MAETVEMLLKVGAQGFELFDQAGKKVGELGRASVESATQAQGAFSKLGASIITFNQALDLISRGANIAGAAMSQMLAGIDRGAGFDDLSKRIGVSVEQLSGFDLAARAAGVPMETLALGVRTLSTSMVAAASGNDAAKATFDKLGVSVTDAAGQLKSADVVMLEVADKLSTMDAGAQRTAASMEVFGSRAGATLLTFLSEGSEGLERFNQLSRDFGLVLTPESAAAMDSVGDNLTIIAAAAEGVAQQFAVGLAPALSELTDEFVALVASLGIGDGSIRSFGEAVGETLSDVAVSIRGVVEEIESLGSGASLSSRLAVLFGDLAPAVQDIGVTVAHALWDGVVETGAAIWRNIDWKDVISFAIFSAIGGVRGVGLAFVGHAIMEGITGGAEERAPDSAGQIVDALSAELQNQAQSRQQDSSKFWDAMLFGGTAVAVATLTGPAEKVGIAILGGVWGGMTSAASAGAGAAWGVVGKQIADHGFAVLTGATVLTAMAGIGSALIGGVFAGMSINALEVSRTQQKLEGAIRELAEGSIERAQAVVADLELRIEAQWDILPEGTFEQFAQVKDAVEATRRVAEGFGISGREAAQVVADLGLSATGAAGFVNEFADSGVNATDIVAKMQQHQMSLTVETANYSEEVAQLPPVIDAAANSLAALSERLASTTATLVESANQTRLASAFYENLANTQPGTADYRDAQSDLAILRQLQSAGVEYADALAIMASRGNEWEAARDAITEAERLGAQQSRTTEQVDAAASEARIAALREGIQVKGLEIAQAQQYATLVEERRRKELSISDPTAKAAELATIDAKIARLTQEGKVVADLTASYSKSHAASKAFNDEVLKLQTGLAVQEKFNEVLEERLAAGEDVATATEAATDASQAYGQQLQLEAKYGDENADTLLRIIELTRQKAAEARTASAIATIEQDTAALAAQIPIMQAAIAGTISRAEAERQIAVELERQNLLRAQVPPDQASRLAEEAVKTREEWTKVDDQFQRLGETGVEVGALIGDAFSQTLDGLIAGTLDFGQVWESFTVSMGKQLFDNLWNEKLNFDEGFKFNILDLLDWTKGTANSTGGLFDGLLGGGSGGSGGGGSFLNLLTGGGGGSAGWLLGALGAGAGAGGAHGTAGLLTGIGANAIWQGFGQLAISNLGQDALALLGGETFAGTVGEWAGNAGWIGGGTWGGQLFGGGSVAGSFGGGAIGSAAGGIVTAGLGIGASYAGQATADAFGIRGLQGTEGQIHMAIGNTIAQIIGNYFAGPLGGALLQYINEILQPLLFGALGIAQGPTKGTLQRRAGESYLDSIPTFGTLQEQFGDVTRKNYRIEDAPGLTDARERLGEDAMRDISGFAGIFAQMMGGDVDGGGRVAGMVEEWTNILTDFFGRMDTDAEGTGLAIRQHLAQAFREMGVDAADAMEVVNKLGENLLFAGGAQNVDYFGETVSNVTNLGEAVRGTAAIFESELPAGVHIAALALETMGRDGVAAFSDLDAEGRETLLNLTDDAENFDKVLAHLFEQGFRIDTEEFEKRLEAITQSAAFLGENIGQILSFDNVGVGIEAVFQNLKSQVFGAFQETSLKQLFETTNIAAAFEPVFAALARIEEFDLTTATGSQGFMDLLLPALAQGKANLQEYIPILQLMADNWKEIEKIIDEAMAPDDAEKAAIAIEQVFSGLGGILEESLTAGVAVLASGGTYQEALNVFKGSFAVGVEAALKQAAFNAMVDAVVLQPLIQKWQPALSYVMTAGIANGFDDPKVREAWRILLQGLGADAEALAPLVFDARLELEDGDTAMRGFFASLQASVNAVNQSLAGGISSLIRESIDIGIEDGLQAGQKHFAENIGDVMYDVLLDAIVRAFVDSVLVEGILGDAMAEGAALYAAAVDEAGPGGRIITPEEQAGINEWRNYWREVYGIAREEAEALGRWLIDEGVTLQDPEGGNPSDGYYTTRRPTGDVDPIDIDGRRGRDSRGPYDAETEGRRIVEETVKPPAEALADLIDSEVIPGLKDFTSSVGDAADALRALMGEGVGSAPPPDEDTGRRFPGGRGLDGAAAMGGTFGRGSTFLVGEQGPEVVVYGEDGSMEVIPIDRATMQSLLDGGVPGYARGTGRPSVGDIRGGRGGGSRAPVGGGGGSGWGLGGPFIGADDARNPANNSRVGPVDVEIELGLEEAIEAFLRGGSLADFEKALSDQAREGVIEGLIAGMLESGPIKQAIEAFNGQMSAEVEKAMKDGIISAQEQADLDALATKLEGGISAATQKMAPVVEAVGKALGIGIESSTKEAIDGISGDLEGSLRAFFEGGPMEDMEAAIGEAVYQAFTSGIIQALLTTGPLGQLIDDFGSDFSDAFADAMEDGIITAEEEGALRDLANGFGEDMSAAIAILGPVYGPMFQEWAEEFGVTLNRNVAGLEGMLGGAMRSALLNGDTFEQFSNNAREALYGSIVDGLVQAFIDSAVINGLLAGPLAAINQIFLEIGEGQIDIAEANVRLLAQTDLIKALLKDPTFEQAWNLVMGAAEDVRQSLGLTREGLEAAAGGFADVATEAENACAGECEWERKLVEGQEKNATLDEYGRAGYEVTEEWKKTHQPTTQTPTEEEILYGPGPYGNPNWQKDPEWRRERARARRARDRGGPDDDGWYYDDDAPWNESASAPMAAGSMYTAPPPYVPPAPAPAPAPQREQERPMEVHVFLDGKEISQNSLKWQRRQSRGGQSVTHGVS